MMWSSMSDFVDMGGYALYVWGAYGVAFGLLAWEVALLRRCRRRAHDDIRLRKLIDGDDHDGAR